jgi:hypothetical protein
MRNNDCFSVKLLKASTANSVETIETIKIYKQMII